MSGFDDIKLGWGGKVYTIPARKALGAIARIEQVITLKELTQFAQRETAPMAMLAQAYGSVLRYAGADVTDEDIYTGMFGAAGQDVSAVIAEAVQTLMLMMIPPAIRAKMDQGGGVPTEPAAKGEEPSRGNSRATGKKPSADTSKQRSRKAGARR